MLKLNEVIVDQKTANATATTKTTATAMVGSLPIGLQSPMSSPSPLSKSTSKSTERKGGEGEEENEDTEFIQTIINIYNHRMTKGNSKYYNILYKTSMADKKRGKEKKNFLHKNFNLYMYYIDICIYV